MGWCVAVKPPDDKWRRMTAKRRFVLCEFFDVVVLRLMGEYFLLFFRDAGHTSTLSFLLLLSSAASRSSATTAAQTPATLTQFKTQLF
jgi:hypothetical protein